MESLFSAFLEPLRHVASSIGVELDHPAHVLAELALGLTLLYLLFVQPSRAPRNVQPLTKEVLFFSHSLNNADFPGGR